MKQVMDQLAVCPTGPGLHEITGTVAEWVRDAGIESGLLTLFVRHTSASLIIQENADPDVVLDIDSFFQKLVPDDPALYRHRTEGRDDMPAHIKGALTQTHLAIPVNGGAMELGTWQGVFLYEHRTRPRQREISLHLIGE